MRASTTPSLKDDAMEHFRKKSLLLLLLSLFSLAHSSLLWQYGTDGAVSARPVIFQGALVVASEDGSIYALEPSTGARRWQTAVGKTPNEVLVFDNAIIASTTGGRVVKTGPSGNRLWELNLNATPYNVSYVYGASANQRYIFVSANNGVYEIGRDGAVVATLASFEDSVCTAPAAGPDYAVYGSGRSLVKLSESGSVLWNASLASDSFWLSRPVIDGSIIYVGALDGRMHAFSAGNGLEIWDAKTGGWVLSTPLVDDDAVYFGSNDAHVYAVAKGNGEQRWAAQTQLAMETGPEAGTMGGKDVVFAGGSDRNIYAMAKDSGEVVWKGSAQGAIGSPLFYEDAVIFGASDGKVYSYSTERACSITSPREADIAGLKEVVVSGKYVSEAGGATVYVNINDGDWEPANTSGVDWVYYIDPKGKLNAGLNTISCKVSDSGGDESGPVFTTVAINHDPGIPPSNLVVTVSPAIVEKKPFVVFVNDGDDGSPVDRFTLTFQGKEYDGDRNVTLVSQDPGTFPVSVKKLGFNDAGVNVTVNASGVSPVYLVGGSALILIILWRAWGSFKKGRTRKG